MRQRHVITCFEDGWKIVQKLEFPVIIRGIEGTENDPHYPEHCECEATARLTLDWFYQEQDLKKERGEDPGPPIKVEIIGLRKAIADTVGSNDQT